MVERKTNCKKRNTKCKERSKRRHDWDLICDGTQQKNIAKKSTPTFELALQCAQSRRKPTQTDGIAGPSHSKDPQAPSRGEEVSSHNGDFAGCGAQPARPHHSGSKPRDASSGLQAGSIDL